MRLVNHVLRPCAAVLLELQDRVVDAIVLGCFHQRKPSAHAVGKLWALLILRQHLEVISNDIRQGIEAVPCE